jgi:hypothetical protein
VLGVPLLISSSIDEANEEEIKRRLRLGLRGEPKKVKCTPKKDCIETVRPP